MAAGSGGLRAGVEVVEVHVRGVSVWLALRWDVGEVARRRGGGAVLDRQVLEGLLRLPVGMPVAESALASRERELLRGCPQGALERRGGELVRWAVRPLRVDLAVVRVARPSREALARAGRFGAYVPSVVWVDGSTEGAELLVMEAGLYGVGVVGGGGGGTELLVAPRGVPGAGHTSAGWLFAEQVYGELVRSSRVPVPIP